MLQGQNESKKRSRSVETKGTAMSFGFNRKKLPTQKRNTLTDGVRSKDSCKHDLNVTNANILIANNTCCIGDDNGNSGELSSIRVSMQMFKMNNDNGLFDISVESIETLDEHLGRSTPRLSPPKKESAGAPYRSTRFGFRINRPASTDITVSKNSSCENVVNNNHSEAKPNGKEFSKKKRQIFLDSSHYVSFVNLTAFEMMCFAFPILFIFF